MIKLVYKPDYDKHMETNQTNQKSRSILNIKNVVNL